MAEEMPTLPGPGFKGAITTDYKLRFPLDSEVAEVPQDMENLAMSVERALAGKLAKTDAATLYQSRIQVVVGTTPPASAPEGTVIFLIAP